jgi:cell filamentation protein
MLSRMYRTEPDPYCYPGTTVLINRLGTTDQSILNAFEAEMTSQRAAEPLPVGRLSYSHYRAIHRHFFQDVYDWAGRIRTVRMSKGSSEFCYPENIDRENAQAFWWLDGTQTPPRPGRAKVCREGRAPSRRAQCHTSLPRRQWADATRLPHAAHPLKLQHLDPTAMLAAMIASFQGDEAPLAGIIVGLVR